MVTALSGLALSPSTFASDITVAAPVNGTAVASPVWVRAHNVGCNGLTPTSFGYSVDNSSTLVRGVTNYDIDTTAAIGAGTHTIHYKSWVNGAVCPVVSTTFAVAGGSSTGSSSSSSSGSGITVTSPVNGSSGDSATALWVRAHSNGCNGKASTAFGYSIDNNATLHSGVSAADIDSTGVAVGSGTHTIHFKSWVSSTLCPVVNTTFTAGGSSSGSGSSSSGSSSGGSSGVTSLPSNAVASALLDNLSGWSGTHDSGTPGSSNGSMVYPATTPSYDKAREFYMTYSSGGGERWHVSFGNNATAENFVLDTYVYFVDPSQVQNLELDLNQVTSDGKSIMFNTQCSSDSKTWEYTVVTNGSGHWKPSNVACNPLTWAAKTWHHIQIGYHRDSNGNVTHDWVNFDGTHSVFSGTTNPAAQSLGWAKGTLLTNLQIDGLSKGSGSVTAYIHNMVFYHW
jgi:hypothetical protein